MLQILSFWSIFSDSPGIQTNFVTKSSKKTPLSFFLCKSAGLFIWIQNSAAVWSLSLKSCRSDVPLLHLQCIAPLFWAVTWPPARCLMASDRRPRPSCGYTSPLNSPKTRQPSAWSKRQRAQTHCSIHTEAGRACKQRAHTHTHPNTHTHTHTHWLHAKLAHSSSLPHAFRLSLH